MCSLRDSQNFLMQLSPLYASYLFLKLSNVHIVGIEYLQKIFSPTFIVNEFSKLFLHPSFLSIKDLRSSKIIDDVLSNFCYYFDSNMLVSSDGTITPQRYSLLDF